jgi:hypothetical protein
VIVVPVAGGNGEGDFVSPCLFFSLRVQVFEALFISYLIKLYFPLQKTFILRGLGRICSELQRSIAKLPRFLAEVPRFLVNFRGF